jgi:hypothetical protein
MPLPRLPSASELFDTAIHPEREPDVVALGLEVVARPGEPAPAHVEPDSGIMAIRRALGENRLATMSPVSRIAESRQQLEAEGVECEGRGDGLFAEVGEWRGRRKALRIAGANRLLVNDMLLVRPRPAVQTRPSGEPPSKPAPDTFTSFDVLTSDVPPDLQDQPTADVSNARIEPVAAGGSDTTALSPAPETQTEAITDAIVASRPPLAISTSVGRAGRNAAADVKAVQNRLVELRLLDAGDGRTENPAGPGPVPDTALAQTIDAIERFQRQAGIPPDGSVDVRSPTRTELDLALPPPTAAELAAVASERRAIRQSLSRGLTIKGPVGATSNGNAPDDVRAVQRRLVDIGSLSGSHLEAPPASTTAAVPQTSLHATIAALRAMRPDVEFWQSRATIAGTSTPGVVTPGDATAVLLDRISVYNMSLGGNQISFRDHISSGNTRSETGVKFVGIASPSGVSLTDYKKAVGLSAGEAAALKQVSTHEGSFDAINTYDRALVSAGFIQFAGSRGLPRYLALLKLRHPGKFKDLLQKFGIDVELVVTGGRIDSARTIVLDPEGQRVLRGPAAEAAIRDDMRLTTALIVSGRDRDVQLTQLEAAVRDYVLPILNASVTWTTTNQQRATLKTLFRSQKGMATLFDRCIQEGLGAARRRFERVIQNLLVDPDTRKKPAPTPGEMQRREGDILAEVERDLQATADVAKKIRLARTLLSALIRETHARDATAAGLLARPEVSDARRAVLEARVGVPAIVNVTTPDGVGVKTALDAMTAGLDAEEKRLALVPVPDSVEALAGQLTASRQALASAGAPVSTAPMFLARVQRIRRSTLDAGIGAAEGETAVG